MIPDLTQLDRRQVRRFLKAIADGVPADGLTSWITVGEQKIRSAFGKDLARVTAGESLVRFMLGNPGSGKSHLLRLLATDAADANFATSHCTHDLQSRAAFNRPDQIYVRILTSLSIPGSVSDSLNDVLSRWGELALKSLPPFRRMGNLWQLAELGLLPDAKSIPPRTKVALLGYMVASERGDDQAKELFVNVFRGDRVENRVLATQLTRLGVEPKFIGYTPSVYDTGFYFGQLATLAHLIKTIGLSGIVVLVDEAAAITDLRSNSRRKAYKVVEEIIQNTHGFRAFYMVISYLPALFTQLVRDCDEFSLPYLARWKSVLGPDLMEVQPLSSTDKYELFGKLAKLHSLAYGWQASGKSAYLTVKLVGESEKKNWSTRDFVRSSLGLLDKLEEAQKQEP